MARGAPFCHRCAWEYQSYIGRAMNKALVHGTVVRDGVSMAYEAGVDLCEVCFWLYETDPTVRLMLSTRAGLEVANRR